VAIGPTTWVALLYGSRPHELSFRNVASIWPKSLNILIIMQFLKTISSGGHSNPAEQSFIHIISVNKSEMMYKDR
jgi:hypothetical protein